jgi:hypothetical protein
VSIENETTAAHELGHGIAMREAGFSVSTLRVFTFMGGGRCELKNEWARDDDEMRGWLVGLVAGFAAEDYYRAQRGLRGASRLTATFDFDTFHSRCEDLITEGAALAEAHSLLLVHWDELEELVPGLAESGRMSGAGL